MPEVNSDEVKMPESVIDQFIQRKQSQENQAAILKEEIEEYKRVLNIVFSSPAGKEFGKYLLRYCGIFTFDKVLNPAKLVEDRGKRAVYLDLIRPYLEKTVKMELEGQ